MLHIKYNGKMYHREVPEVAKHSRKNELFLHTTPWRNILQNKHFILFAVPISLQLSPCGLGSIYHPYVYQTDGFFKPITAVINKTVTINGLCTPSDIHLYIYIFC